LFRKALDRYVEQRTKFWDEAFEAPTARGIVDQLLHRSADFLTETCNPPGCMLVRSAVSCSETEEAMKRELTARRTIGEVRLRERLEQAKINQELPPELDPADYARYIMAILEGMCVRGAGGATRPELHSIADMALRTWPA
jgi:hypothetical protein